MIETEKRNRILLLLFVGVFMGALDIGIIGPALPAIEGYFKVDPACILDIHILYTLLHGPGIPHGEALRRYGARDIYILDIILFAWGRS